MMNAARAHTLVTGVNHHGTSARLERIFNRLCDLCRHGLQAFGKNLDDFDEFRNADNLICRQIGHPSLAKKWRNMMLAMRLDVDFAQDNHIVIARYIFEDAREDFFRVLVITPEPFLDYRPPTRLKSARLS